MKFIFTVLLLGFALTASLQQDQAFSQMRRALANQLSYQSGTGNAFPPFNPKDIEGWDTMSKDDQDEVKLVYSEFEKLAHMMDDWANSFDKDIETFNKQHPDKVQKPVSTPAALPAGARKDTGSRGPQGWRRILQEGTSRQYVDGVTVAGKYEYGIHRDDSYVHVGEKSYPDDPRGPSWMDKRTPPRPQQTVQPPARPIPTLPTVVDLTKDVRKPRTPETKEIGLNVVPMPSGQPSGAWPAPSTGPSGSKPGSQTVRPATRPVGK